MADVSSFDREQIRLKFCDVADELRQRYNMTVPEVRKFLRELLNVAV